ncbi:FAH family protein [Streptomyces sp. NPDC058289]|uniref:FAH family protein n=1 Tax=Streptomyces sp. NPDC058289 TaxID=3346425 RepID=UPI0036E5605C
MTVLFECTYDNERWFGLGVPRDDTDLRLYALGGDQLGALMAESGLIEGLGGSADALTAGRERLDVRAEDRRRVRMLPPLMPEHVGDAVVSGFMMTHNVKADASTPDQPNWFVKGLGDALKLSGEPLSVPFDAVAVCEEAEVVLVYVGDEKTGRPVYMGHSFGNDVTDIGRFKQHNGHLSYAKLCDAAISPALHVGPPPPRVTGETVIERDGAVVWSGPFTTGTDALFYDLDTIMATLMDYEALRRPGRVHYVYIGADRSSFHAGHEMADGDRVTLDFAGHGVTLVNRLAWGARA